jgi:hypothetical protein
MLGRLIDKLNIALAVPCRRRLDHRIGVPPRFALVASALMLSVAVQADDGETEKQIFGWLERVLVTDHAISMRGKLDTGAKTSSLHATNITPFTRDGIDMVRYDVEDPREERILTLESPLVRTVAIKEKGAKSSVRPIVEHWLCIGDIARVVEVNLVDRGRFNYPLLIGRTALADVIVVDPGETFTRKPTCGTPGERR